MWWRPISWIGLVLAALGFAVSLVIHLLAVAGAAEDRYMGLVVPLFTGLGLVVLISLFVPRVVRDPQCPGVRMPVWVRISVFLLLLVLFGNMLVSLAFPNSVRFFSALLMLVYVTRGLSIGRYGLGWQGLVLLPG